MCWGAGAREGGGACLQVLAGGGWGARARRTARPPTPTTPTCTGPSASTGGATVIGFNGQKVKLPKGAQLLFADGDGQAVTALVGEGQGRGNTAVKAMGFAFAQGGPVNATLRKGAGGKPWGAVVKVAGAVLPSGAQTTLGGGTTVKALAGGAGVVISTPTLRVTAFTRPQGKPQTGAIFNIGVT